MLNDLHITNSASIISETYKDILIVYCGMYTRLFTSELLVIAKIRNDFNVYLKGIG